jgi:hypothetical protein
LLFLKFSAVLGELSARLPQAGLSAEPFATPRNEKAILALKFHLCPFHSSVVQLQFAKITLGDSAKWQVETKSVSSQAVVTSPA